MTLLGCKMTPQPNLDDVAVRQRLRTSSKRVDGRQTGDQTDFTAFTFQCGKNKNVLTSLLALKGSIVEAEQEQSIKRRRSDGSENRSLCKLWQTFSAACSSTLFNIPSGFFLSSPIKWGFPLGFPDKF